jgi:hypothetical protein
VNDDIRYHARISNQGLVLRVRSNIKGDGVSIGNYSK